MATKQNTVNWGGLNLLVDQVITGVTSNGAGEARALETKGTVTTTATTTLAEEAVSGKRHTVQLDLTNFAVGTSGDLSSLAIGASLYTLPAGDIIIERCVVRGAITAAISVTTDTPEFGLGNVVGSGANATLGAVGAGAENICGPWVATNVAGDTPTDGGADTQGTYIATADPHVVYFNVADSWADVTAAGAVTFTGYVVLEYRVL